MRRLHRVMATAALAGAALLGSPALADVGDVTYTDMLGGRVTFTQIDTNTVRMSGQFNEGFDDPDARCLIYVGELPPPGHLDATIIPPGTSPFQYDYEDVTISDFTDVPIRVICDNEIVGVGGPTVPAE